MVTPPLVTTMDQRESVVCSVKTNGNARAAYNAQSDYGLIPEASRGVGHAQVLLGTALVRLHQRQTLRKLQPRLQAMAADLRVDQLEQPLVALSHPELARPFELASGLSMAENLRQQALELLLCTARHFARHPVAGVLRPLVGCGENPASVAAAEGHDRAGSVPTFRSRLPRRTATSLGAFSASTRLRSVRCSRRRARSVE
jgi:hypothetical protein